jgi:hypothetical protein
MTMGLLSRNRNTSNGDVWQASTHRAPWWSAGAGTHRAEVSGIQLGDYPTRKAARRAAQAEAVRRNAEDE